MGRLILASAILIGMVVVLGLAIDVQSRSPVARQERTSKPSQVFASGRIEGTSPEVQLRPQLAGAIVKVNVSEGQIVAEGDVLLQLDDRQYRQEIALASAEVALAEAQLDRLINGVHSQQRSEAAALCRAREAELQRAETSWKRIEGLLKENSISQQEADNQRLAVEALRNEVDAAKARSAFLEADARPEEVRMERARIDAAKARLELAKVQADRASLRAPMRAQVLKVDGKVGELAGPATPEPTVVLADTSRFFFRAYVEELDAPRVTTGMAAKVAIDGQRDLDLRGRVVRLSPRMDRKSLWSNKPTERYDTKTREVWIELESEQSLVVGLRADAIIDTTDVKDLTDATSNR